MSRRILILASLLAVTAAQTGTQQTQKISLDPDAGPLKLRIVFQSDNNQPQNAPCATGNCQAVPTLTPCASGNCGSASNVVPVYDVPATTTPYPVTVRTVPVVSNNNVPVKVIRIPSYSNTGCSSPWCGAPRFVYAQPPCFGYSCGGPRFFHPRRHHHHHHNFSGQRPIFIGNLNNNNNMNNGGNVAIPDTIYKDGKAYRAPVRVPSSYQDGNPVFGK
uniref:Uncharacterized protein n=1 Tax=Caenorhabditis japonica TaxID=281687 RepID=A0A8R1DGH0_CAEJA